MVIFFIRGSWDDDKRIIKNCGGLLWFHKDTLRAWHLGKIMLILRSKWTEVIDE